MPGKFSKVQLNLSHQADDETKYVDVIFVWPLPFWMLLEFSETTQIVKGDCLAVTSPGTAPLSLCFGTGSACGLRALRCALQPTA